MVRFKSRYILSEVRWSQKPKDEKALRDEMMQAIKSSIQENFGDFGVGVLFPTLRS